MCNMGPLILSGCTGTLTPDPTPTPTPISLPTPTNYTTTPTSTADFTPTLAPTPDLFTCTTTSTLLPQAMIEHITDGTTLRLFLQPEIIHVTLQVIVFVSSYHQVFVSRNPPKPSCVLT